MMNQLFTNRPMSLDISTSVRIALRKIALLFTLIILGWVSPASALDPVHQSWRGNAIDGYDPVAYFVNGEPTEGSKEFQYEWNDATWLFASQQNLEQFKVSPEKYAPQYGGYCAWAVSQGSTAPTDPEAWTIHDGKLYLNYNKSVQEKWLPNKENNIIAGDKNWPGLLAD